MASSTYHAALQTYTDANNLIWHVLAHELIAAPGNDITVTHVQAAVVIDRIAVVVQWHRKRQTTSTERHLWEWNVQYTSLESLEPDTEPCAEIPQAPPQELLNLIVADYAKRTRRN